jgi:hypothetical protein
LRTRRSSEPPPRGSVQRRATFESASCAPPSLSAAVAHLIVRFQAMGEFLGIMFSIIFLVTPKDMDQVQIWPNAADAREDLKKASITFRRSGDGWYPSDVDTDRTRAIFITDGNWVDEHGKVLLEIKGNLSIKNGTNYVFKPKDWERPLEFSIRESSDERTFEIKEKGTTVRESRVKMWKSNKSGAANGSQPIRSETNTTSSAAGSRR